MGLGSGGNRIYLSIREGKIAQKVSENDIRTFDHVSGTLANIKVKEDGKFGPELHVTIVDKDYYTIQMFLTSGYASAFLKAIRNADIPKRLTLIPTYRVKDDKKQYGMIIQQNGQGIKWFYTKDNPQGMPEMEHGIWEDWKGDVYEGWNARRQLTFLMEQVQKYVLPRVVAPNLDDAEDTAPVPQTYTQSTAPQAQQFDNSQPAPDDDLPF